MSAIYKCHACGASVVQNNGEKSTVCEYCGKTIVFPQAGFVQMNRANDLRAKKEFDQAIVIYENLKNENRKKGIPDDPEIWWNILLCEYGIEYVEDDGTRIPTVNRMNYDSVFDNEAYKNAVSLADDETRTIYENEAQKIEEIQKEFHRIASNEEKYDVFISFKDKEDDTGERTRDGEWAQLIYNALTDEGYNVFFSRITLRSCPGHKFEPKIFAALQSAPVMIVVTCSSEHVNAVWVKNEWSRFLKFSETNLNKYLIPVYADMKLEELPDQLTVFQCYEANGTEFLPLIIQNINDRIGKKEKTVVAKPTQIITQMSPEVLTQLKKDIDLGYNCVKNEKWEEADRWFEEALNINIDYAPAWWGKLVVITKDFSLYGDFRKDPEAERFYTQAMGLATQEEEKRFENDLARYDAVQKSYKCEELFKRYARETNNFTRFWIGDSTDENKKNILLENLEHNIFDLATGKRESEIRETIDSYKIRRQRIRELNQQFNEIEDENKQIAGQSSKIKNKLDEMSGALIRAKNIYPAFGWLWIIGIFVPPVILVAIIKTIVNISKRKAVYGTSSKQLKADIADQKRKYADHYDRCKERIKDLNARYDSYCKNYGDVMNYVIPENYAGYISQWQRKFGMSEYENYIYRISEEKRRKKAKRFFLLSLIVIIAIAILGSLIVPKLRKKDENTKSVSSGNNVTVTDNKSSVPSDTQIAKWREWQVAGKYAVNDKFGFLAIDPDTKKLISYGCPNLSIDGSSCKAVSISSTNWSAAVVHENGTVSLAGKIASVADVSAWQNIHSVQISDSIAIALTENGTLISSRDGELASEIKQYHYYTRQNNAVLPGDDIKTGDVIAVRTDGTVYCSDSELQAEIGTWKDIVYIVADKKGKRVAAVTTANTLRQYNFDYGGSTSGIAFPVFGADGFRMVYLDGKVYSATYCDGFNITVDKSGVVFVSNTGGVSDEKSAFVKFIKNMKKISVD